MHNRSFTRFNFQFPQLFGSSFNALEWITALGIMRFIAR